MIQEELPPTKVQCIYCNEYIARHIVYNPELVLFFQTTEEFAHKECYDNAVLKHGESQ